MNNKGADQSAQMHRVVCTFVLTYPIEDRFSGIESQFLYLQTSQRFIYAYQ